MKGKVIIVTGGSGLIGKAIVDQINEKGGLAINADLHAADDLDKGSIACDITTYDSIVDTVKRVEAHFGKIDCLVNNAYPRTKDWGVSFEEMPHESLSTNIEWQLTSYMNFCKAVIPGMVKQKSGSIINITSIYGIVGNDFTVYEGTSIEPPAAYTAIKGGLINFSRYLASKYGIHGVRVNCVSPGGIFDHQPEPFVKAYEKKVPMKRMGTPSDIAPPVAFLLSEEAQYITGQNLAVDGGWTCI